MRDLGTTSTGLQPNVAAVLAYVLGIISGVVVLLTEKENRFVKFHAIQAVGFSVAVFVLSMVLVSIPVVSILAIPALNIAAAVLWVICMIKAYQGQPFKLPVVGDIAAKQSGITTGGPG